MEPSRFGEEQIVLCIRNVGTEGRQGSETEGVERRGCKKSLYLAKEFECNPVGSGVD